MFIRIQQQQLKEKERAEREKKEAKEAEEKGTAKGESCLFQKNIVVVGKVLFSRNVNLQIISSCLSDPHEGMKVKFA